MKGASQDECKDRLHQTNPLDARAISIGGLIAHSSRTGIAIRVPPLAGNSIQRPRTVKHTNKSSLITQ